MDPAKSSFRQLGQISNAVHFSSPQEIVSERVVAGLFGEMLSNLKLPSTANYSINRKIIRHQCQCWVYPNEALEIQDPHDVRINIARTTKLLIS